jgi:uncharacterized protein YjbI with pentapeptide repeats
MANTYSIRHRFSDKVLHIVETGDRKVELCAPDLSGLDLSNLILNDANLCAANLEAANLRGTKLVGADLARTNLKNADLRYSDLSGADLREADLTGSETYPCGHNRKTNFWDAKGIDSNSELSALSAAIMTAKLRRSGEPDEFDLHQAQKETESFLSTKTKRLEKTVSRERHNWNLTPGNPIIKAKLRILRYHIEITLNRERLARDLRFLRRQGVDTSFADKFFVRDEGMPPETA